MGWQDVPCKEWTRATTRGYGHIVVSGSHWLVHRLVWTIEYGVIPRGKCICHHCDNPACYEIAHLFLGTPADNARDREVKGRGNSGATQKAQTHCKRGHEFDEKNTYYFDDGKHRACLMCRAEKQRQRRARKASS